MSTADTYVRARIDTNTKERATEALAAMGLSISDAIRLLMLRVADERRLPFEIKVPSAVVGEENKGILTVDRSNAPATDLNADK
ncbi:MAG: type II toxin-antitoxin system RelB/DinJ family antitoxin [Azonexus sp.]|nr:type II toxin-antitoxin system RelB/DinJ family antitoxin [Azonexus sp.]